MSLRPNLLAYTVSSLVVRRSTSLVVSRSYASTPYPFTKPNDPSSSTSTSRSNVKAPYPFTKSSEPTQVAPPTSPVERPGPRLDDSDLVSVEAHEEIPRAHQPDYNVALDYRTSSFSPIPLRVMDGSEDTDVTAAAVLSGAPTELQARTVRIYKPAKTATQSGDWHGHHWRMDWDILEKGHRWENPLMGWQSSGDMMQGTHIGFKSKDDAIRFAEKQGYEYFVQEPNERRFIPKAYATQFIHHPGKLKEIRTK